MFCIWYLYRTYKASVEENEEVRRVYESTTVNDNKTEEDMDVGKCLDERTITGLVLTTLRNIGCGPTTEQHNNLTYTYFTYQGENFTIESNDEYFFLVIYDPWWYSMSIYSDVDDIANLHKVVNLANQYTSCTLLYTTNKEMEEIGIHSKRIILFVKEIPNLDQYLISVLNDFFKVKRFVLTELDKCKVEERI